MIAECIVTFMDIEANKLRDVGEQFEVSPERFEAINSTKYGTLAKEVKAQKGSRAKKASEAEE